VRACSNNQRRDSLNHTMGTLSVQWLGGERATLMWLSRVHICRFEEVGAPEWARQLFLFPM